MGKLINGEWVSSEEQTRISEGGDFVRGRTTFRDWIRADGSSEYPPQSGRYHLWVAHNCPWAHRAIIARNLKHLADHIPVSFAHHRRDEDGWWFPESEISGVDGVEPTGKFPLHVLYSRSGGEYTGSATVPVLWDRERQTIVSNESADIIVMLDQETAPIGARPIELYPADLRAEIDEVNGWVYETVNNGVYKCGFARTQEAYERAFVPLFESLDRVEQRLGRHRYLAGGVMTLADVRLFTTVARFDAVYHGHFKCNLRRIVDFPNLWGWARDMFQTPGIGETVEIEIYKKGYYGRSPGINPRGIIPLGPALDFTAPHDRGGEPAFRAAF